MGDYSITSFEPGCQNAYTILGSNWVISNITTDTFPLAGKYGWGTDGLVTDAGTNYITAVGFLRFGTNGTVASFGLVPGALYPLSFSPVYYLPLVGVSQCSRRILLQHLPCETGYILSLACNSLTKTHCHPSSSTSSTTLTTLPTDLSVASSTQSATSLMVILACTISGSVLIILSIGIVCYRHGRCKAQKKGSLHKEVEKMAYLKSRLQSAVATMCHANNLTHRSLEGSCPQSPCCR